MPRLRLSPVLLVMNIALIIYALTALLSLRTAYDPSLSEWTMMAVIGSVLLYFCFLILLRRTQRHYAFSTLLALLGAAFTVFFISQFKYQSYIETPEIINRIGTITSLLPNLGVFIHPNSAATVIELLLPLVVALIFMSRDWRKRGVWLGIALLMLYAFGLTYSRGAFVGLGAALVIGLSLLAVTRLSGRQAMVLIGGLLGIVMIGVALVVILGPRVPFVSSLLGVTTSRLEIYRNSIGLASDYIFTGIGLGDTFGMMYSRYSLLIFVPLFTYTHNLLLAVLLGQGIVGLLAFAVIVVTFYLFMLRVLWIVRVAQPEPLFYGAWIGVTATLIHGLTDARQYVESPFNLPLLFVMMALAVSCGVKALREEVFEERGTNYVSGWKVLTAASVGVALVVIAGYVFFSKPLLAAWHTNLGALDEARADTTIRPIMLSTERDRLAANARSAYEQALAIVPDYPNANRRLGNMLVDAGEYEAAIPLLEKAFAAEQYYQASIKGLGLAYMWVGRTEEAACVLRRLSNLSEMTEELYNWQNYRHEQQQDLQSAYALETAALLEQYQQTNMEVWALIGDRYASAGQRKLAQVWYSRVLLKDANHTGALTGLEALGLEPVEVTMTFECAAG